MNVWQVPPLPDPTYLPPPTAEEGAAQPRKLLLLRPKLTQRNISCAAISDLGGWIVICDSEIRLYRLSVAGDADGGGAAFKVFMVYVLHDVKLLHHCDTSDHPEVARGRARESSSRCRPARLVPA